MSRILVTGSALWNFRDLADEVLERLVAKHGRENLLIVHGDYPTGVDRAFAEACKDLEVRQERHTARWHELGDSAGPARDAEMIIASAKVCLAFHPDVAASRGTLDCVQRAIAEGIETWHVEDERGVPKRIRDGDERLHAQ